MQLLENANVAVSPGRGFGETGEGHLRLALVENEQRLRQAVRQVAPLPSPGAGRHIMGTPPAAGRHLANCAGPGRDFGSPGASAVRR